MNKQLYIKLSNGEKFNMSLSTYAKWLCLLEAMHYINNHKLSHKLDLDRNLKWIKPIEFQKYLDARYHGMLHDIKVEEHLY